LRYTGNAKAPATTQKRTTTVTAPSAPTLEQRLACWPKLQQQRARYDNITLAALIAALKRPVYDWTIPNTL
jgi:hypothetical protein